MAAYRDLILTLCAILAAFAGLVEGQQRARDGCTDTRDAYRQKGLNANEVPQSAIAASDLNVCPNGYTCCTSNMEFTLTQTSSAEFENIVYEKSSLLRDYVIRRTERFDTFVKELIDNSQNDLHEMFVLTYGTLYEQYKEMFEDLYSSFRNYYHGVDLDLEQVMEDFFAKLFERIFQLLNPQYRYTDEFWECSSQYLESLRPFGEVPAVLKERAKRSFVAARTFVQGLSFGRDAVTRATKVEPTPECRKALMRMSYCPHCKGIPFVKPCYSLCLNILKGCLASQAEMDAVWNYYIDAMTNLGTRMEGLFNIETFMQTLDIEISNGIMNMQNNGVEISRKVFSGCGVPDLMRKRRDVESPPPAAPKFQPLPQSTKLSQPDAVDDEDLDMEDDLPMEGTAEMLTTDEIELEEDEEDAVYVNKTMVASSNNKGLQGRQGRRREGRQRNGQPYRDTSPTTAAGTNLDRLIKDVLKRLRDSRPFWSVLPYMICDDPDIAEDVAKVDNCWNGQAIARYSSDLVGNGLSSQSNNPEMNIDTSRPTLAVKTQMKYLQMITDQLESAYNGEDTVFMDNGQGYYSGSGSGSGSGDGGGEPDDNSLFPFSTAFLDPIYRPTRTPPDAGATSLHTAPTTVLILSLLAALSAAIARW